MRIPNRSTLHTVFAKQRRYVCANDTTHTHTRTHTHACVCADEDLYTTIVTNATCKNAHVETHTFTHTHIHAHRVMKHYHTFSPYE